MATELERLVVTLEAQTRAYERALAQATNQTVSQMRRIENSVAAGMAGVNRSFSTVSTIAGNVNRALGAIGVGFGVAAITRGIGSLVEDMGNLEESAQSAGTSVENFQRVVSAGLGSGLDEETITAGLAKFNDLLGEAATKGNEIGRILKANNIAIQDGEGNFRDVVDILGNVADLIKSASSDQERLNIATAAMGKAGREWLPLLRAGGDELRKMLETARVLPPEMIRATDQAVDAWHKFVLDAKRFAQEQLGNIIVGFQVSQEAGLSVGNKSEAAVHAEINSLLERRANILSAIAVLQERVSERLKAGFEESNALVQKERAEIQALQGTFSSITAQIELANVALQAGSTDIATLNTLAAQLNASFTEQLATVNQLQAQISALKENGDFVPPEVQQRLQEALLALEQTSSVLSKIQGQVQTIGDIDPTIDINVTRGAGSTADPAQVAAIAASIKEGFDKNTATIEAIKQVLAEGNLTAQERTQLLQRLEALQGQAGIALTQTAQNTGQTVTGVQQVAQGLSVLPSQFGAVVNGVFVPAVVQSGQKIVDATHLGANQITGAIQALPDRMATSLGPLFRSGPEQQQLGLDFAFPQQQQINALELERERLQLQIQAGGLSDAEVKAAQARINEIGQEIAKLQLFINELHSAVNSILPSLTALGLGGIDLLRKLAFELERLGFDVMGILSEFERSIGGIGAFAQGGIIGRADGGPLPGTGTDSSDSNIARFSKGEFLVNAPMSRKYRDLLWAINEDRLEFPKLASGGLVGPGGIPEMERLSRPDLSRELRDLLREIQGTGRQLQFTGEVARGGDRRGVNFGGFNLAISTPDVESFRKSERSIAYELAGEIMQALRDRGIGI